MFYFHIKSRSSTGFLSSFEEEASKILTEDSIYFPREQTVGECLEDGKVIRSFWDLRQEV